MTAWGDPRTFGQNAFARIRVVLALLVIFSHSFPLILGHDRSEPLHQVVGTTLGGLAVNLFLAISGLLVTHSWETSANAGHYLLKRFLRIYPAFVVMMIVQAFIIAPLVCAEPFAGYSAKQLALLSFETADLVGYGYPYGGLLTTFPTNPFPYEMNGSLWSIRYEFLCYLLIVAAVGFRQPWVCIACFAVVLLAHLLDWRPPGNFVVTALIGDVRYWPRLLSYFLAGVAFYRFRRHIPYSAAFALLAAAVVAATAVVWPYGLRLALPTCGVYLLFFIAYRPALRRFPWPILGDPSYGTYLYGFPIQQMLVHFCGTDVFTHPLLLAAAAVPLSLLAGLASWHLVEKRFLALKPTARHRPPPSGGASSESLRPFDEGAANTSTPVEVDGRGVEV